MDEIIDFSLGSRYNSLSFIMMPCSFFLSSLFSSPYLFLLSSVFLLFWYNLVFPVFLSWHCNGLGNDDFKNLILCLFFPLPWFLRLWKIISIFHSSFSKPLSNDLAVIVWETTLNIPHYSLCVCEPLFLIYSGFFYKGCKRCEKSRWDLVLVSTTGFKSPLIENLLSLNILWRKLDIFRLQVVPFDCVLPVQLKYLYLECFLIPNC